MKTKRKILMITPYIPRLSQSGGQRHSFYTIKYLSPKNNITLICYSRDQEGLEEIKNYCQKVIIIKRGKTWDLKKILKVATSPYPFLLVNYLDQNLKKAIKSEIDTGQYDLIHCDCLYSMPDIPTTTTPIVLVDVTIEYAIYQHYVSSLRGWRKIITPLLWLDVLKLKYWETYYWKNTHTVIMFSTDDRDFVSSITGRKDIQVFEDGVDPKYFSLPTKTARSNEPTFLVGISNMKWMQNRESVEIVLKDFWPQIRLRYPTAKLYIIGRNSPEFFGKYQSSNIIVAEADAESQAHDPQYFHEYCWIQLAPMGSGGGTRNKFLEGMTFTQPVITTTQGGMGNIKIVNFKHAVVCNHQDFLPNLYRLVDQTNYRLQMGHKARSLIQSHYSFKDSVDKLNQIYDQITIK